MKPNDRIRPDAGEPLLYTVEEARRLVGIGRTTAYHLTRSGQWPTVRIGRVIRVPSSALKAWIKRQTSGGKGDA